MNAKTSSFYLLLLLTSISLVSQVTSADEIKIDTYGLHLVCDVTKTSNYVEIIRCAGCETVHCVKCDTQSKECSERNKYLNIPALEKAQLYPTPDNMELNKTYRILTHISSNLNLQFLRFKSIGSQTYLVSKIEILNDTRDLLTIADDKFAYVTIDELDKTDTLALQTPQENKIVYSDANDATDSKIPYFVVAFSVVFIVCLMYFIKKMGFIEFIKPNLRKIVIFLLLSILLTTALKLSFGSVNYSYAVNSYSMVPTYYLGDLVFVKPTSYDEISVNDIIAYDIAVLPTNKKISVLHRVISKNIETRTLTTKGDNNLKTDSFGNDFSENNIKAKAIGKLPYAGYLEIYGVGWISKLIFIYLIACMLVALIFDRQGNRPLKTPF